jgi:hypothetical protein
MFPRGGRFEAASPQHSSSIQQPEDHSLEQPAYLRSEELSPMHRADQHGERAEPVAAEDIRKDLIADHGGLARLSVEKSQRLAEPATPRLRTSLHMGDPQRLGELAQSLRRSGVGDYAHLHALRQCFLDPRSHLGRDVPSFPPNERVIQVQQERANPAALQVRDIYVRHRFRVYGRTQQSEKRAHSTGPPLCELSVSRADAPPWCG